MGRMKKLFITLDKYQMESLIKGQLPQLQRRFLLSPEPPKSARNPEEIRPGIWEFNVLHQWEQDRLWHCPYGSVGTKLLVKEEIRGDGEPGGRRPGIVRYGVDGAMVLTDQTDHLWTYKRLVLPARSMPLWASRFTLVVTDVCVERNHWGAWMFVINLKPFSGVQENVNGG